MSKKADEIRSDIEQTRGAMSTTLEALGDRVAPKKAAGRAKAEMADKVDDVRHRFSPVGAVRRSSSRLRDSLQGGSPLSNRSASGDAAVDARSSGTALADEAGKLADRAGSASESLTQQAAGNPLAVGLLAFGAGMVAAGFLPSTERERQVAVRVKERVEPLKDHAVEAGRTIMGELKPAAEASIEQVKERSTDALEQVKGQAKGSAKDLKENARTASGQVKQTTKSASGRVRSQAKRSTSEVKGEAERSGGAAKKAVKGRASSGGRRSASSPASRPRSAKAGTPNTRSKAGSRAGGRAGAATTTRRAR